MENNFNLENRLKYFRVLNGENQTDLADSVGLSQNTISAIENGQGVSLINALKIADHYNVYVENIFTVHGNYHPFNDLND